MRRIFVIIMAAMLVFMSLNVFAEQDITVKVDGNIIEFPDAQPFINDKNRTMVPLRFVSEALGADVAWDGEAKEVTIVKDKDIIIYEIGSLSASLNNQHISFDTWGIIKDARTFVPLRFMGELLNCNVEWIGESRTVEIMSPPEPVTFPEPKVTVHFPDNPDTGRLFRITLDNIRDYADCDNYQFKIDFVNPIEFNTIEYHENEIVGWRTLALNQWRTLHSPSNELFSIGSEYYTTRDNMETFKMYDGMPMDFILSVQRLCSGEIKEYQFADIFQYRYPK